MEPPFCNFILQLYWNHASAWVFSCIFSEHLFLRAPFPSGCFCSFFILLTVASDMYASLLEKCSYSELFRSAFSRIWTEYFQILRISPYSVRMLENADQNNSEYGHFSCSALRNTATYFFEISFKFTVKTLIFLS